MLQYLILTTFFSFLFIAQLWPAAQALARWMGKNAELVLEWAQSKGGGVLEVGAGSGLPGLAAAKLLVEARKERQEKARDVEEDEEGALSPVRVVLSDSSSAVLELLQHNIQSNFPTSQEILSETDLMKINLSCRTLSWSRENAKKLADELGKFSLVLGSDIM